METLLTIDHYDEKTDQVFRIPVFNATGLDEHEFMTKNKAEIVEATLGSISVALEEGYEEVPVFSISSGPVFHITSEEFGAKLQSCMDYYLSIEAYEFCSWIKDLQDKAA